MSEAVGAGRQSGPRCGGYDNNRPRALAIGMGHGRCSDLMPFVRVDAARIAGGSVERGPERDPDRKGSMHHVFIPPPLILSFLLGLVALLLNAVNPGVAAVVGAIAAVIFMAMLIGWGR